MADELKIGFPLEVDEEEDWPPFDAEHLWFRKAGDLYELDSVPLFLMDLSLGDLLRIEIDEAGYATQWSVVTRSPNSTVWMFCPGCTTLADELVSRGYEVEHHGGIYSVNIRGDSTLRAFHDLVAASADTPQEFAYPSLRHQEPGFEPEAPGAPA